MDWLERIEGDALQLLSEATGSRTHDKLFRGILYDADSWGFDIIPEEERTPLAVAEFVLGCVHSRGLDLPDVDEFPSESLAVVVETWVKQIEAKLEALAGST